MSVGNFSLASRIAAQIRNSFLPFEGMQVIACGGYFQLPSDDMRKYNSIEEGDKQAVEKVTTADEILALKINALVICVANISDKFRNGTPGVVDGFNGKVPRVYFETGFEMLVSLYTWSAYDPSNRTRVIGSRTKIPLTLSYLGFQIHSRPGRRILPPS